MSLLHDSVDYSGSHFQHSAEELVQLTENDKDGKDQMDKLGGVAGKEHLPFVKLIFINELL